MKQVKQATESYLKLITEIRRMLHQYPELSGKEEKTAAVICAALNERNISYKKNISGHGVVATIQGKLPGNKTVALRADMDALPIQEISDKPYKSVYNGVMHACGHDVHMACLLGCIFVLHDMRDQFGGTVKLIFQPSEEQYDGGADVMIRDGVLSNPEVDIIFAQHVSPEIEVGKVGVCPGEYMASTDEIHLTVHGKGGHAGIPNENIDPVAIGAQIVVELQQVVSRMAMPQTPTVLSFGRFIADGSTNIIPDKAFLSGTFRTFDEVWREKALAAIRKIAVSVAESFGAGCDVNIKRGYPVLVNDPEATGRVRKYAEEFLGKGNVLPVKKRMTAEDFAYFLQKKPGMLYRLGTSNHEKNITGNLHTGTFDIDEKALSTGIGLMAWIAMNELRENLD